MDNEDYGANLPGGLANPTGYLRSLRAAVAGAVGPAPAPSLLTFHQDDYVPPPYTGCSICFGEGVLYSDDPEDDGTECTACGGTGIPGGRRG